SRRRRRGESRLLDRHGEPGDQLRDFIQMFGIRMVGIMRFNGLREPKQAFVVTHGGNADWNNRRYRADQVGRSGWHRISSRENPARRSLWGDWVELAARSITPLYAGMAQGGFRPLRA